jgi:hypothetical protein
MLTICTRGVVTRLQDIINNLTSSRPPASAVQPMTENHSSGPQVETLIIPVAPEALDEANYPDIPYWNESNWTSYTERQRDHAKPISRLGFLTDEDGKALGESRIKEITSSAKQAWNELYRHRLDPVSWTKKTPKVATFFTHMMKVDFPEFCFCDGNWKVERFAIIKYPDWCRDVRESGRLTRVRTQNSFDCTNVPS